jgi:hypothetical protein
VLTVHKIHWLQTGASFAAASTGFLLFIASAGGEVRSAAPASFDLAVREVNVTQLSSTPLFRTVEITCVMENRGPRTSNATGWLSISRPGDVAPQVLGKISFPKSMEPGDKLQARSQGFAWVASAVPYRCELQFGGTYAAGDADPSNDFAEFTFPKL